MDFEGLKVGVGGNLKDGFWISCVPKADIAVDRGRERGHDGLVRNGEAPDAVGGFDHGNGRQGLDQVGRGDGIEGNGGDFGQHVWREQFPVI